MKRLQVLVLYLFYSILLILIIYFRWKYSSPYARTWDEVDFVLALDRFDLRAMQPHFPGYPYFIFGGLLMQKLISDPVAALSKFNVIMTSLSFIPIFLLSKYYVSQLKSFIIAVVILSITYTWVISASPISEGAAIAILWWYLWSLKFALDRSLSFPFLLIPVLFFGLMMGTRLSFMPFGLGIILLFVQDWKHNRNILRSIALLLLVVITQLVWIVGLIATEGSLEGFLVLASAFIEGHFNNWGGAVTATNIPVLERLFKLTFYNLLWVGLFGKSVLIALLFCVAIIAMVTKYLQHKIVSRDLFVTWLVILTFCYFLWALFAQNIDKPRHISPLMGIIALIIFYFLFKHFRSLVVIGGLSFLVLIQVVKGVEILKEQVIELPAIYQLIDYLREDEEEFRLYTWEETRVLEYAKVPFEHKRIYTFDLFLDEISLYKYEKIYLTGRILEGFERQVGDLSHKVERVAVFQSNPYFDPIYSEITLYEWK